MKCLAVTLILLTAATSNAAPYLAVSPAASPLHMSYDYDRPGTGEAYHPDATLDAWAVEPALGAGYEYPLGRHWGVWGRLEFLTMRNIPSDTTDRMNALSVRAGLLLVWRL